MKPIASTAQILAYKMLNKSIDEVWINWAVDMLMAGFETENLVILAGMGLSENQFELQALTDRVLQELQLSYSDTDKVIKNYVSWLLNECLNQRLEPLKVLRWITDMYNGTNQDKQLQDFYLLYWAKDELLSTHDQWYWPDADRSNIDSIITNYFTQWLTDNPVTF